MIQYVIRLYEPPKEDDASVFSGNYGALVWAALNSKKSLFNALPRQVWGNTSGWRVRTNRGMAHSTDLEELEHEIYRLDENIQDWDDYFD